QQELAVPADHAAQRQVLRRGLPQPGPAGDGGGGDPGGHHHRPAASALPRGRGRGGDRRGPAPRQRRGGGGDGGRAGRPGVQGPLQALLRDRAHVVSGAASPPPLALLPQEILQLPHRLIRVYAELRGNKHRRRYRPFVWFGPTYGRSTTIRSTAAL